MTNSHNIDLDYLCDNAKIPEFTIDQEVEGATGYVWDSEAQQWIAQFDNNKQG